MLLEKMFEKTIYKAGCYKGNAAEKANDVKIQLGLCVYFRMKTAKSTQPLTHRLTLGCHCVVTPTAELLALKSIRANVCLWF